ncbi:SDR family oxidoreductase [Aestuariirhabdus litorea]|uniref:SDR family oxidoreductase n=1 Tax=Aestuariirhabdus litorea TaxID=2528527 RepID=A0A3P3VQH7_9GAMM|nr:SDR family oxidoreductase [Aestuariirhabdus litorea]RRJ84208.1 SDR family oxidoreductase [Aestuariirhabdus litorea]RWW97429.1 SDR family oxidoreductase [Endozoicomonadaceae bacterium GTF-13]
MSKRVLITGAGSGLGRELAHCYARQGWRVALTDVNDEGCKQTASQVEELGGEAERFHCDVRDLGQMQQVADTLEEKWGGLDLLINNAGVAGGGSFADLDDDEWDWMLAINLKGVINGCRIFLPSLLRSKGQICNIASMAGLLSAPGMSHYNVAKAGVVALSESLQAELASQGMAVSVVCPSFFQTNLLDSYRGSSATLKENVAKLLAGSPISAQEVAQRVVEGVEAGQFMILPHDEGALAWEFKRNDPESHRQMMEQLAVKMAEKGL